MQKRKVPPKAWEWREVAEDLYELLDHQDREVYEADAVRRYYDLLEREIDAG